MTRRPPTPEENRVAMTLSAQHLDSSAPAEKMAAILRSQYSRDSAIKIARTCTGATNYWSCVEAHLKATPEDRAIRDVTAEHDENMENLGDL